MYEYRGNLHIHSTLSDGHGTHDQIAEAALQAGLDFLMVTDHNLRPDNLEGYRYRNEQRVLMLIGEEVHDRARSPEKSHLLVYGAGRPMADFARDPQVLIDEVATRGGLSFLAHPFDCAAPDFGQPDLSWEDWQVERFTGLEIWNFMVDFKCRLRNLPAAIYYSYLPSRVARGASGRALALWDRLLANGKRIVAIGNSDAHALPARWGPLRRTLFPYAWLFRAVNTHVLCESRLTGEADHDRDLLLGALRRGRCFVACDRPASSQGFSFRGQSEVASAAMGDELPFSLGATLQVHSPFSGTIRILRNGKLQREWSPVQSAALTINQPGAYRAEVHLRIDSRDRPWVYSNPIYAVQT